MIPLSFFLLPRTLCDSLCLVLQLSRQLRPLSRLALVLGAYLLQIFQVRFQDLLALLSLCEDIARSLSLLWLLVRSAEPSASPSWSPRARTEMRLCVRSSRHISSVKACQASGIKRAKSNFLAQIKIGSQKNRLGMGLREIESKHESIFCSEKSDIEVYLPRA